MVKPVGDLSIHLEDRGHVPPPIYFLMFYRKAKNSNSFTIGGPPKFDLCPQKFWVTDRLRLSGPPKIKQIFIHATPMINILF